MVVSILIIHYSEGMFLLTVGLFNYKKYISQHYKKFAMLI